MPIARRALVERYCDGTAENQGRFIKEQYPVQMITQEKTRHMDQDASKTAPQMIPCGIYVLTAKGSNGAIAAATVNWVTQTAFDPPILVAGVTTDSSAYGVLKQSGQFALNMLGNGQPGAAFACFNLAQEEDGQINGQAYHLGTNGAPVFDDAPACVECRMVEIVGRGDHHIIVGEVTEALFAPPPDEPMKRSSG